MTAGLCITTGTERRNNNDVSCFLFFSFLSFFHTMPFFLGKRSNVYYQNSSTNNRSSINQSIDTNESNQQSIIQSNIIKKHKTSMRNKSHEEASFDYFSKNNE